VKREREREREKLETDNKEEERCNKLDRREESCVSITIKKHITLKIINTSKTHLEKKISQFSPCSYQKATCLHYININININKNTFNKNVHRSSSKAHHDLLLFVRNNPKS
jgi:hypothetical protein